MSFFSALAYSILFILCTSAGATDSYTVPEAKSDYEKLQLFQAIESEFPSFMQEASRFGFDPFLVLEDQQRLLEKLKNNPNYEKYMAERPALINFSLQESETKKVKQTKLSPLLIENWKARISNTLSKFNDPHYALRTTIHLIGKRNSETMINGLIKSLPKQLRDNAFKQTDFAAKVLFLKNEKEIPQAIIEKIPELEKVFALENTARDLAEALIIIQNKPGQYLKPEDMAARISYISSADIDMMLDYTNFTKPRIDALNRELKETSNDYALKANIFESIKNDIKERVSISTEMEIENSIKKIHLSELSPLAGIFRGCAGGDCATKSTFATPNNPDELVFHITNEKGGSKGYLEATRVIVNEKASLYISGIVGPKISSRDIDLILAALFKEKESLGISEIILPSVEQISSLINYPNIQEKFYELIAEKKEVSIQHKYEDIRADIENFKSKYSTETYDDIANNKNGIIYSPSEEISKLKINTTISEKDPPSLQTEKSLDKIKMLGFILQTDHNNIVFSNRAALALGISKQDWNLLKVQLTNPTRLKVSEFNSAIDAKIAILLKQEPTKFLSNYPILMLEGIINASDSFSAENISETSKIISLFGSKDPAACARLLLKAIAADSSEFRRKILVENLIRIDVKDFLNSIQYLDADLRNLIEKDLLSYFEQNPQSKAIEHSADYLIKIKLNALKSALSNQESNNIVAYMINLDIRSVLRNMMYLDNNIKMKIKNGIIDYLDKHDNPQLFKRATLYLFEVNAQKIFSKNPTLAIEALIDHYKKYNFYSNAQHVEFISKFGKDLNINKELAPIVYDCFKQIFLLSTSKVGHACATLVKNNPTSFPSAVSDTINRIDELSALNSIYGTDFPYWDFLEKNLPQSEASQLQLLSVSRKYLKRYNTQRRLVKVLEMVKPTSTAVLNELKSLLAEKNLQPKEEFEELLKYWNKIKVKSCAEEFQPL